METNKVKDPSIGQKVTSNLKPPFRFVKASHLPRKIDLSPAVIYFLTKSSKAAVL